MKIRFYLALAAAALVMTNCSQDEELVQVKQPTKGFTATIEGASRSNATEAGVFTWTAGDKISVWNGSTFDVYANSTEDVNTFNPQGNADIADAADYAIYPAGTHSISGQNVTIDLPATYEYGSTNAPMLAEITAGSSTLAFKHLGGLMRFVVKDVPEGASSFVFTTTNNIITGNYTVDSEGEIKQDGENTATSSNNNVTITFTELTADAESMVFFVPLPVGTYGEYIVEIKGDNLQQEYKKTSTGVTNTIGRCTMLLMPVFTCTDQGLEKASVAEIPVTGEDVNLSGIQNVTIGTDNATANDVLNINYTPSEGNAALNIKDDSNETESQENSKGKIVINPQGSEVIESLNLNTPTLTAELGAGTYGTVEALTAQQTLVIGSGVTIETLILNGGALQVADGATIGEIIVKDAATLTAAIAAGGEVTLAADVTLTEMATISKDLVLDLGGYTLTSSTAKPCLKNTATTTITNGKIVSNDVGVQNNGTLTINCDIEAVSSAINNVYGCTTTIEGGSYKSTATEYALIAVEGQWDNSNPSVIINDGTFESQFTNLSFNNGAKGQINGGTFNCTGNWYNLYVGGDNGGCDVTYDVEECSFTSGNVNVYVEAGTNANKVNGIEYTETITTVFASTVEGLAQAIARGGNVTLAADITLTEMATIEKNLNLDLGGYTLTSSTAKPCLKNTATTTITNGKIVSNDVGVQNNGTLTINCDIEAVSSAINNVYGCTTTIEGGSYKSTATEYALIAVEGQWDNSNPSVIINDGTFESQFTNLSFNNGAKGQINGGTFNCTGNWYNLYVGGDNGGCDVTYDVEECSFTTAGTIKIYVEAGTNANTVNNTEYTETKVWSSTE